MKVFVCPKALDPAPVHVGSCVSKVAHAAPRAPRVLVLAGPPRFASQPSGHHHRVVQSVTASSCAQQVPLSAAPLSVPAPLTTLADPCLPTRRLPCFQLRP